MRIILGIETSCDETAAAVIRLTDDVQPIICSEVVASQTSVHERYGGVVPELASREHLTALPVMVSRALSDARIAFGDLDGIAVTRGPGLKGCLLTGIDYAKGISVASGIPLVGINHIEGHLLAPLLDNPTLRFPYLALVVSGGHTEIQCVRDVGSYSLIARTTDDAAGEAFDKSANLLGFDYPGGPALAALADTVGEHMPQESLRLPRVMKEAPGFSFSGLKTAVATLIRRESTRWKDDPHHRALLAYSIQEAIVDALVTKLLRAVVNTGIRSVVVTGGVSANQALRRRIQSIGLSEQFMVFFPRPEHCTDNGAMIALAGAYRLMRGERLALNETVRSRWPVEQLTVPPVTSRGAD